MGRRADDVFVIGEEDLLTAREAEGSSGTGADSDGDWAPFEDEAAAWRAPRSNRRPLWLRGSVLALAAIPIVAFVVQRATVSGASAVASGLPAQRVGGPLVLGSVKAARRRSHAPRDAVSVRPAVRRPSRRAHPAARQRPPAHHVGRSASRHRSASDSQEVTSGTVEEREDHLEEAPQSVPVEVPSSESVPVEPTPESAPAPVPSGDGGRPGAGGSGADEFGFER